MVTPKYKFSLFRLITGFTFEKEKAWDPDTGEVTKTVANAILSNYIHCHFNIIYSAYDVDLSEHDTATGARNEAVSIIQFDEGQNFIGIVSLKKRGLYILDPDTRYIRLSLTSLYPELIQSYERMVLRRTSFNYLYGYIRDVKPVYSKLTMKYKKESNQEFLRKSLEGKINLFGQDYEFLKSSSIDSNYMLLIEHWNNHKYEDYYTGLFNKVTCKFDYEKCKCELKLTTLDQYTELLSKYDNTYDLLQLGVAQTDITLHKRPIVQLYVRGSKTVTSVMANTYYEHEVDSSFDGSAWDLAQDFMFNNINVTAELLIKNAKLQDINGIYAGVGEGHWSGITSALDTNNTKNKNGYIIKTTASEFITNHGRTEIKLGILNPATQEILYESDFFYDDATGVELINKTNSSDKCIVDYIFREQIYARLLCDVDSIGGRPTYNLPSNDFVNDPAASNYHKCIGLSADLVKVIATPITTKEPTKFGKNDYNEYFTNYFYTGLLYSDLRVMPLCRNSWVNSSLWFLLDYSFFENANSKEYTLKDGWNIADVIMTLLAEIDPGIKHRAISEYSDFLYNGSGEINTKRFEVFLTQKTNILKGEYDQAAQKAEISFKDIMDMLRDCFRCYMFIEDGKLKIEHVSYFYNNNTDNNTYDITFKLDRFNKQHIQYFQSEIEYGLSDLYPRYEFSFADDATFAFDGLAIDVNAVYTKETSKNEISISKFSSDIDMMLYNPSEFGEDGFALMCCKKVANKYAVPIVALKMHENNREYEVELQNGYAAFLNLVSFYMYDMPAYNIKSNIAVIEVKGLKHFMKHTIQLPVEHTLAGYSYINTSFGPGKIDNIDIDMNTMQYKIDLLYNPG